MLNWLKKLFRKQEVYVNPVHTSYLKFVVFKNTKAVLKFRDYWYKLIDERELQRVLDSIDVSQYGRYVKEYGDCDDIQIMMWGDIKKKMKSNAFCKVETNNHALLGYINSDYEFKLIENNKEIKDPKEYDIREIEF